jgi:hypothetical protein
VESTREAATLITRGLRAGCNKLAAMDSAAAGGDRADSAGHSVSDTGLPKNARLRLVSGGDLAGISERARARSSAFTAR